MYQQTDKFLKALKKKIRNEFNHLSVMSFDELNVVRISKELKSTYKRLIEFNHKEYELIAEEAHLYALSLLSDEEKKGYEHGFIRDIVFNLLSKVLSKKLIFESRTHI